MPKFKLTEDDEIGHSESIVEPDELWGPLAAAAAIDGLTDATFVVDEGTYRIERVSDDNRVGDLLGVVSRPVVALNPASAPGR